MTPECPSDEQLERLAAGAAPAQEEDSLRRHLAGCSACRQAYEEWQEDLPFAGTVKAALGEGSSFFPRGLHDERSRGNGAREERLTGYLIEDELHHGAQGLVCRALHEATGRTVAIKFLHDSAFGREANLRRFEREVELASSLHHPNIVQVRESGVTPRGRHYYVMDYVPGVPLHHYVWDHRLTLEETLRLFVAVCEAVNYAHQRGVIHRDLKPSNILVDAQGVPHVLDFGLAKQLLGETESLLSMTGQVVGTLPYMSPEQALGRADGVDIRTDVYALGVILYQVLTGSFPYPVVGPIPEVLRHIGETSPTPPAKAWSRETGVRERAHARTAGQDCPVDADLETILLRALAKEPQRRYQNVNMLSEDILRYLEGQPIEARRDAGFHVLTRTLARYKAAVTLTGTGLVIIALFAATLAWMYEGQVRQREQAALDRARAVEAQAQLADALMQLGDSELEQADEQEAMGRFLAALTMYEHLAEEETDNRVHLEKLADALLKLGDLARDQGDRKRAREYYERLNNLAEQLSLQRSNRRANIERLRVSHERLAALRREAVTTLPASMPSSAPE